jgi:hypothetical protein
MACSGISSITSEKPTADQQFLRLNHGHHKSFPSQFLCAYSSCMHAHYYLFIAAHLFWQQILPRMRIQLTMPVASSCSNVLSYRLSDGNWVDDRWNVTCRQWNINMPFSMVSLQSVLQSVIFTISHVNKQSCQQSVNLTISHFNKQSSVLTGQESVQRYVSSQQRM